MFENRQLKYVSGLGHKGIRAIFEDAIYVSSTKSICFFYLLRPCFLGFMCTTLFIERNWRRILVLGWY